MRPTWLLLNGLAAALGQAPGGTPDSQPASQPEPGGMGKVVDFAPGIRINWPLRQIEVEARVVLREGALELFACSPRTREHESIVSVAARPRRIYEALGLIGLAPGAPIRFDEDSESFWPPYGAPVAISVRYEREGRTVTDDISRWMRRAGADQPLTERFWVFAGSLRFDEGRFGADLDGTVVCVVDFDTALLALPQNYSSSDEQLWLEANTPAIPPEGTRCTLIFRAADVARLDVAIGRGGELVMDGREVPAARVFERLGELTPGRHGRMLVVVVDEHALRTDVSKAVAALLDAGVGETSLQIRTGPRRAPPSQPAEGLP